MKEQRRFNVILKIMAVIISLSIVIGCASTESVQAATKKSSGSTYYVTLLNHQNGGRSANGRYWMPGTKAVRYDKNSITFFVFVWGWFWFWRALYFLSLWLTRFFASGVTYFLE